MRIRHLLFLLLLIAWRNAPGQPMESEQPQFETVHLKRGTPISLRILENINSWEIEEGHLVQMEVVVNVVWNRKVLVATGAFAEGKVAYLKKRGILGQSARIGLEATSLQAVDGQRIPLQSNPLYRKSGRSRRGLALGVAILVPVSGVVVGSPFTIPFALLGIFVKGQPAKIQIGEELSAVVKRDTEILVQVQ